MEIHDKFYKVWLERFCAKLNEGLIIANKEYDTKAAYIILIIRDVNNPVGHIDIASNLNTDSIEDILEESLNTIKNQRR